MDNWISLINTSSNIIFSVVISWYLLSKAIPDLQKSFSNDLKMQRDDFTKAIQEERLDFNRMVDTIVNVTIELNKTMNETVQHIRDNKNG